MVSLFDTFPLIFHFRSLWHMALYNFEEAIVNSDSQNVDKIS